MKNGYIKVSSATPSILIGNCNHNEKQIIECIKNAYHDDVKVLVLPELCITGYTAGDLFFQDILLESALNSLFNICRETKNLKILTFVGLPLRVNSKIYNVCATINEGIILGFTPKMFLPNYNEFYERRQFASGINLKDTTLQLNFDLLDYSIPFSPNLIFSCLNIPELLVGCEICEDLWAIIPPSSQKAINGAIIIANLSASNELVSKAQYREQLVTNQSARLIAGYIYACAGPGESTSDVVYGAHNIIAENGSILACAKPFSSNPTISALIDIKALTHDRTKISNYYSHLDTKNYIPFSLDKTNVNLTRVYPKFPFVPYDTNTLNERLELILNIQAHGLKERIKLTRCKSIVVGLSGGLDSALALLVMLRSISYLDLDPKFIIAITMPCFGTTDRTLRNAKQLASLTKVSFKEINILKSVELHMKDIGLSNESRTTAYENAQARERTQVLMDTANLYNGMVIGTGDLSELALGWCTYNGDHMSMYGVNASVPKTLVKYLIKHEAERLGKPIATVLLDILDTPISPELLPAENGTIIQKTESIIGSYVLHDFFLYYLIRCGFSPSKVLLIATRTFKDEFSVNEINKVLHIFITRFFNNQFKRNCLPDCVKIGSVALSPRGDWRMPSEASAENWISELDNYFNSIRKSCKV
ncbi:MAG: NAD(+) synthase [Christensenellaceae bacterium]|jgi:NAD+ synthase (glutamine-hydrolysing)|nr:NAD(+) synthase [Christensenellaceae bacterium]